MIKNTSYYRECCKAVRLLVFATILQASYDEENRVFLSPDKLPKQQMDSIKSELEDIVRRSSEQKNNVKLKSFGFTVAKKSEVQDLLDSILKIAYPYISQGRTLTDMNKQLEYSLDSGASLKFSLLPEALPVGYEDRTQVIVGSKKDKNGIKSVVKVNVWRSMKFVWYEHKNAIFYKLISSESDPVNMEDAGSGHMSFSLRSTGEARKMISAYQGEYTLTEKEHRGRPVYSDRGGRGCHLYTLKSGAWGVGDFVGDSKPVYRGTTAAPSPALCQRWQYSTRESGGPPFKDGDITVDSFYFDQRTMFVTQKYTY